MAVNNRLRPPRRFNRVVVRAEGRRTRARPSPSATAGWRTSGWRPAPVDFALRGLDILLASIALLVLARFSR